MLVGIVSTLDTLIYTLTVLVAPWAFFILNFRRFSKTSYIAVCRTASQSCGRPIQLKSIPS